jgi:hypothetical protein
MATPSMTASVWGAKEAYIADHDDFCTLTVRGGTMEVKFFLRGANAADVQSIADAFNAVLSPKAKDATDAE